MSSTTTVAEFAAELNKPTATLIEQLTSAGVAKVQPTDPLSEADKQKLLSFLQASHGTVSAERKKITLVKNQPAKSSSRCHGPRPDHPGRGPEKRTFVKRDEARSAEELAPAPLNRSRRRLKMLNLVRREEEPVATRIAAPPGRRTDGKTPPA